MTKTTSKAKSKTLLKKKGGATIWSENQTKLYKLLHNIFKTKYKNNTDKYNKAIKIFNDKTQKFINKFKFKDSLKSHINNTKELFDKLFPNSPKTIIKEQPNKFDESPQQKRVQIAQRKELKPKKVNIEDISKYLLNNHLQNLNKIMQKKMEPDQRNKEIVKLNKNTQLLFKNIIKQNERPTSPVERPTSPVERPTSPVEKPALPVEKPADRLDSDIDKYISQNNNAAPVEKPSEAIDEKHEAYGKYLAAKHINKFNLTGAFERFDDNKKKLGVKPKYDYNQYLMDYTKYDNILNIERKKPSDQTPKYRSQYVEPAKKFMDIHRQMIRRTVKEPLIKRGGKRKSKK